MHSYNKLFEDLFSEMSKVVVGQRDMIEQIMIAVLSDGNVLLEGYPGLAKTLTISTLSKLMDLRFSRIQNTPDLMPSDITGTFIIDEQSGKRQFKFHPGPLFANLILADEINRATPKTQSALLEAMQEKQVTVGTSTFKLDLPFFVLATMNPIEMEGTYPLPEAQTDRFLLKTRVTYPSYEEEREIVDRYTTTLHERRLRPVLSKEKIISLQGLTRQVPIAKDVKERILRIVTLTRTQTNLIAYGASPRASISMVLAAKARALINGRNHVGMDDVKFVAYPVLRHRIILNFEAERKGMSVDDAITEILKQAK